MTDSNVAPAVRSILETARNRTPPTDDSVSVTPRSLPDAITSADADGRVPIVAEVKPTSPTTDGVREDDPVDLARRMVDGGASAISVLTEPDHFGGSPATLERVRSAVDVPVLRKDFVLEEAQLDRVAADVILLIARFVDDLADLLAAARERGFQVLVEVHTRDELREALAAGAAFVGVNNRDLAALEVDLSTFERVVGAAGGDATANESPTSGPAEGLADVTLVAESGISTPADVRRMRRAGADALLVGSAIMGGDVEANTRRLVEAGRAGNGRPEDEPSDAGPESRSGSDPEVDVA
ncbi:indole-3-glycerol phosphate synthase [Halovivax limisalsi]|uniref:indole-3-glycerol phosphate synthase n=1 Tax=Halovivax limisalsi TaxID=1453760 RepID=UPI001FFC2B20